MSHKGWNGEEVRRGPNEVRKLRGGVKDKSSARMSQGKTSCE